MPGGGECPRPTSGRHLTNMTAVHRSATWVELVSMWLSWLRASGAPETTVALRRYYVERLAHSHPDLLGLGVDELAAWLGAQPWAPNTRKSARAALRSFYGWARATGRLDTSPADLLGAVDP